MSYSFLSRAYNTFSVKNQDSEKKRILLDNSRLKQSLAEVILDLKKPRKVGRGMRKLSQ